MLSRAGCLSGWTKLHLLDVKPFAFDHVVDSLGVIALKNKDLGNELIQVLLKEGEEKLVTRTIPVAVTLEVTCSLSFLEVLVNAWVDLEAVLLFVLGSLGVVEKLGPPEATALRP